MLRRNRGIYQADPLWAVIMAQLKTQALELISVWEELSGEESTAHGYQVEQLLSQIEDSLELTRFLPEDRFPLSAVNLAQVAEDFGETFARRFGPRAASTISLLVDPKLPVARTHPFLIMRVLDCLARSIGRVGAKQPTPITLTYGEPTNAWPFARGSATKDNRFKLIIRCTDVSFAVNTDRIQETLLKFRDGNYVFCVFDLGLDLCAAFHLVRQMDGVIKCEPQDNDFSKLEIEINLEKGPEQPVLVDIPNKFHLLSNTPTVIDAMKNFAVFHASEMVHIHHPSEAAPGSRLVYDATGLQPRELEKLKELPHPENTVILVDQANQSKCSQLGFSAAGFHHVVTVPVGSSRVARALAGREVHAPSVSASQVAIGKKLHVLVVDDAETARIIIRDYFESAGHAVTEASDGAEFGEFIKRGMQFDLVFCDLNMYHVDGLTAVKSLREHEKVAGGHTPVVMMTAYAALEVSQKAEEAGYDRLLHKPVDCDALDRVVQELLTSSGSRRPTIPQTEVIVLDDLRRRCAGKTTTMIRVLDSFVSTSKAFVPKLQSDDLKTDNTQLAKALHTIKGLLREVAAQDGARALEQLEEKLKSTAALEKSDLEAVERWITDACESAETMKRSLQE